MECELPRSMFLDAQLFLFHRNDGAISVQVRRPSWLVFRVHGRRKSLGSSVALRAPSRTCPIVRSQLLGNQELPTTDQAKVWDGRRRKRIELRSEAGIQRPGFEPEGRGFESLRARFGIMHLEQRSAGRKDPMSTGGPLDTR